MRDITPPQPECDSPAVSREAAVSAPAEAAKGPAPAPRVLVALPSPSTSRLVRETLESFTGAKVETASDPLRAFELALQLPFRIYLVAMRFDGIDGPLLYDFICKALAAGRAAAGPAPGVVFVREKGDPKLPGELLRDARVRDVLTKPVRIERLLEAVGGVLDVRDPTAG